MALDPNRQRKINELIAQGMFPEQAAIMVDNQMGSKGLFASTPDQEWLYQTADNGMSNLPEQGAGIPKTNKWEGYTGYPSEFKSAEEYGDWAVTQGKDRQGAMEDWTKMQQDPRFGMENDPNNPANKYKNLLPLFGGPRDLAGRAYGLGQSLGQAPGSKNKGLNVALNAASLAAGTARGVFSGFAGQKMNNYVEEWNRKNLFGTRDQDYKANPQTRNENTLGGIREDGGLFRFDDGGGFMNGEDEQESQHNSVEEGGEDQQMNPQMQQAMGMIAQAVQDGQPPQIIIQALVSKGMPEEQATQLVAMVVEKLQQGRQGEEKDDDSEEEQSPKDNMMKRGGTFKHKVGDYIKFKHKGELKEGKIKRIENGKIFL